MNEFVENCYLNEFVHISEVGMSNYTYLGKFFLRLIEQEVGVAGWHTAPVALHVVGPAVEFLHGWVYGGPHVNLVFRTLHAHVFVVILHRKSGAVQGIWPRKPETLQNGVAPGPDTLTKSPARSYGVGHLLRTHGHINRTQEKFQVLTATVLDQRRKGLQIVIGLLLDIVAPQIGHPRHVVPQPRAHLHPYGFAGAEQRLRKRDAPEKSEQQQ